MQGIASQLHWAEPSDVTMTDYEDSRRLELAVPRRLVSVDVEFQVIRDHIKRYQVAKVHYSYSEFQ